VLDAHAAASRTLSQLAVDGVACIVRWIRCVCPRIFVPTPIATVSASIACAPKVEMPTSRAPVCQPRHPQKALVSSVLKHDFLVFRSLPDVVDRSLTRPLRKLRAVTSMSITPSHIECGARDRPQDPGSRSFLLYVAEATADITFGLTLWWRAGMVEGDRLVRKGFFRGRASRPSRRR